MKCTYRHVPFEVYAEQERRAGEAARLQWDATVKRVLAVDPNAKFTVFMGDEIIIECADDMRERVAAALLGEEP